MRKAKGGHCLHIPRVINRNAQNYADSFQYEIKPSVPQRPLS